MASRRTSRGQPQYLQFRPYRAILASEEDRIRRRSVVRAFIGGVIAWTLIAGLAAAVIAAAFSGWRTGGSNLGRDVVTSAPWVVGVALIAGFLGGLVSVTRR